MRTVEGLIDAVLDALEERRQGPAPVDRVVAGERLLLVELAGDLGGIGVAHRPPGRLPSVGAARRADGWDVARWSRTPDGVDGEPAPTRAVGLATLNALSSPVIDWQRGDPMAALEADVDVIATVGLFRPAFRKWRDVTVRVVERTPVETLETPDHIAVRTYDPEEATAAFDGADVLFVTGSTLVYGGLAPYLDAATDVPTVVLVGATASFLPDPLFAAGVTMMAGARVVHPGAVITGIERGQCGADLHDAGLEKVYVSAGESVGLSLEDDAQDHR